MQPADLKPKAASACIGKTDSLLKGSELPLPTKYHFMEAHTIATTPVTFTSGAIQELKRLMETEAQKPFLRVGVKGGGCSGMTYVLEFDDRQEGDMDFIVEGIPVIMNKAHEMYLFGMQVEFEGGLNSRGFTFKNPNASSTCGCGTSFAV